MRKLKHIVLLCCLASLSMLTNSTARAQSWINVSGPERFARKGSAQATVSFVTFSGTPGPAYVDMDDLATVGADGSVTLNGVVLTGRRAVTHEVGPGHSRSNVDASAASNKLVVSLIGKSKSELQE